MRALERCLQICIGLMAILATTMMGLGGDIPMMTPLMIFVACSGVVFTDTLGWFVLHRYIVNAVAIVAMLLTLTDFMEHDSTGQLLSIAYLLISWEAVMLFQRKSSRVYWCIAVLSLLQVVVASVLNLEVGMGLLMFTYLAVGFFALVFFFLVRELHRIEHRRRGLPQLEGPALALGETTQDALVRALPLQSLFRTVTGLGLVSLVFAAVFFYGAPRVGGGWQQRRSRGLQTGFSSQVTFEEMGRILQGRDPVMRVSFSNPETQTHYASYSNLYFHGAVLTRYANGAWSAENSSPDSLPLVPDSLKENDELVEVSVTLEPTSEPTLFTLLPAYRPNKPVPADAVFDSSRQSLSRDPFISDGTRHRYQFLTTAMRRGLQNSLRPHAVRAGGRTTLTDRERRLLLSIQRERFPGLIALSHDSAQGAASKYQVVQQLVNHFLVEDYTYTLNFDDVAELRDPSLDPIEDFVVNHRRGHCEYFASALAMMLRSQGIPARLAVGYYGGERNQLSGDLRILESDAHAWVEAYLGPDEVPVSLRDVVAGHEGGAWLRLDPTPAGDDSLRGRNQLDDMLDYAQVLWTDYVLEMNPQRQRETFEKALSSDSAENVSGWLSGIRRATIRAVAAVRAWVAGEWFSWRAGVLTSGLLLLLIALGRILYPLALWVKSILWVPRRERPHHMRVDFYERLEKLLQKLAVVRRPEQTQLEFARAATASLKSRGLHDVAEVPRLIVSSFYDVRFGGARLSPQQSQAIQTALERLASAVDRKE